MLQSERDAIKREGRLEAMTEIRDWLEQKKKWYEDVNGHPATIATIDLLWVVIAANVERGGEWSTSIPMDCQGPCDQADGSCSCYEQQE